MGNGIFLDAGGCAKAADDLENEIQQAGNPKGGCLDAMYVNFTYAAPVKGAGTVIEKKCAATNSVEYCTTHKTH